VQTNLGARSLVCCRSDCSVTSVSPPSSPPPYYVTVADSKIIFRRIFFIKFSKRDTAFAVAAVLEAIMRLLRVL